MYKIYLFESIKQKLNEYYLEFDIEGLDYIYLNVHANIFLDIIQLFFCTETSTVRETVIK